MICKHNRIFHENGKIFCYHCGMLIRDDIKCEKEVIIKQTARTTTEAGVQEQNQTEENINHACRKYVLDLSPGDKIMEPKCKMSVYKKDDLQICAIAANVKCEGTRKDSGSCPFWKGVE